MARMRKNKRALCPVCNDFHPVYGSYWLIPANPRSAGANPNHIHIGVQTEFWCAVEDGCVVKQYSPEFKYIGYYIADEIPF